MVTVIYNHKKYEELCKNYEENLNGSGIYRSELRIKIVEMERIRRFLLYD